jgi:hypothetical protein
LGVRTAWLYLLEQMQALMDELKPNALKGFESPFLTHSTAKFLAKNLNDKTE